jgi:protein-disulfide isomerase
VTVGRDHIAGPAEAPLTLVEYGDYQCPSCGAAYPEVKSVQRKVGSKLRFVFRNFPLKTSHEFAWHAAEIAEAAATQGRFWEIHDFLYEHQAGLADDENAWKFVRELDLDLPRLRAEVFSHAHQSRIQEDFDGGVRSGVNGTPTFYVNGTRFEGTPSAHGLGRALRI